MSKGEDGGHLGLHIRRKSGIGQGFDVGLFQTGGTAHQQGIILFLYLYATLLELGGDAVHVLRNDIFHQDLTASGGHGSHIGTGFDLVGNDGIRAAGQPLHSPDLDRIRTGAPDVGAHGVQEVGQINNVRLLGAIFDHRVPLGQNSGHHDVHGSTYGHHVQVDAGPGETARLHDGIDIAALSGNTGAQSGKSLHVLIDGADAAEIATAGHSNFCPAKTTQQSANEIVGSPQLPGKFIRGPGGVDVAAVDLYRMAVDGADGRTQLLQNL